MSDGEGEGEAEGGVLQLQHYGGAGCRILLMASASLFGGGGYNYPRSHSDNGHAGSPLISGQSRENDPRSEGRQSPPSPVVVCDFFSSESEAFFAASVWGERGAGERTEPCGAVRGES